ncbi:MAG TPA: choice-of-anchor Q domain-containing protein [Anaerolineae bacterium]|nr:choice-of-anchor Q domain-containing protein [Anaerolineae bacterium]
MGLLLLGMGMVVYQPVSASSHIIYVDADSVAGTPDGISWTSAYTNVQDALAVAVGGDEIWVAEGVYYPDEGAGQTDNSINSTFALINGVGLYGGFVGTETGLSQRNVSSYVTVLSGDIDQNDLPFAPTVDSDGNGSTPTQTDHLNGTNAEHVVTGSGTDGTAILDGFTVTGGKTNSDGGGMYTSGGSPTISNMTFSGNSAVYWGGGMYNIGSSSPTLSNVTFSGNSAGLRGGGMSTSGGGSPTLSNVTFRGNSADARGGGMDTFGGSPTLSNVTFRGNSASFGGGMSISGSSSPTLSNVTFSGNSATFGGGIDASSGSPTLSNVTFSGNSASTSGGGINSSSTLSITNTIIANSINGGDCVNDSATIDGGNNLIEDAGNACGLSNGVNNNIVGSDPNLGPLADNGGPTLTHKPNSGSLAIDNGAGCSGVDQRGAARPYGAGCDIGAVEVREMLTSTTCGAGDLAGVHDFTFASGNTVSVMVGTANGLNCLTVEEMGDHHLMATVPIQTGNWWHISGNITSGVDINLTLPYVGADAATRVCKWPGNLGGAGWDCDDGSNTTFSGNYVTRANITGFSDWAVGQGANPTTITLQDNQTQSEDGYVVIWVSVAVLMMLSIGVLVVKRE